MHAPQTGSGTVHAALADICTPTLDDDTSRTCQKQSRASEARVSSHNSPRRHGAACTPRVQWPENVIESDTIFSEDSSEGLGFPFHVLPESRGAQGIATLWQQLSPISTISWSMPYIPRRPPHMTYIPYGDCTDVRCTAVPCGRLCVVRGL